MDIYSILSGHFELGIAGIGKLTIFHLSIWNYFFFGINYGLIILSVAICI